MYNFIIYSFLGFLLESAYVSLLNKKIIFSGLLKIPFIPIYGICAIIINFFASLNTTTIDLFFYSSISVSIIEYLTHLILSHDFHIQIWNYTHMKYQIKGRICLFYTLVWGFLGICIPYIQSYIDALTKLPPVQLFCQFSFLYILYTFYNLDS